MAQSTRTISDPTYRNVQEHLHKVTHQNPIDDNIEQFITDLKRRVSILEKAAAFYDLSIFKFRQGPAFQAFRKSACREYYSQGLCSVENCPNLHTMEPNWTTYISPEDAWQIITYVMTSASQPPVDFVLSFLPWLHNLHSPSKVMMISKYLLRIRDPSSCKIVFDLAVKAFMRCIFPKWKTIAGMLMLIHDPRYPSATDRLIDHLQLNKKRFQYYWEAFEPLTNTGYKLPLHIMEHVLKDVCNNPRKDKNSMMKIYKLVEELEPNSLLKLETLVRNFMSLMGEAPVKDVIEQKISFCKKACKIKQSKHHSASSSSENFLIPLLPGNETTRKPSVVKTNPTDVEFENLSKNNWEKGNSKIYEFDKMKAALTRGMTCENFKAVADVIIHSSTNQFHTKIAKELFNMMTKRDDAFFQLYTLFNEITSFSGADSADVGHGKELLAEVCVTQMIKEANHSNWRAAYNYLNLVQENDLNPIKVKVAALEAFQEIFRSLWQ